MTRSARHSTPGTVRRCFHRNRPAAMLLVINCLAIGTPAAHLRAIQARPQRSEERDDPPPKQELREYSPGVRIDWKEQLIELDATVCLREGVLELLACSPQTREHESILAVHARPMHIYQAMGLIGLEPGSPARYDSKRGRWVEASGESLRLEVRYHRASVEKTVPVERWLFDSKRRRLPERLDWVFAGSRNLGDGRFGADVDGTIVTVVDFDTALIALASVHSSENQLLWLAANTPAIPPVGTPCTLLIRAAGPGAIKVEVTAEGSLRLDGKAIRSAEVAQMYQDRARSKELASGDVRVVLQAAPVVSAAAIESVLKSLVRAGVDRASIEVGQDAPD